MSEVKKEYVDCCKDVAEDLEMFADGNGYKCPHCERVHKMSEYEETEHENDTGDLCYTCPNCGGEVAENELEAVSMYDYFTGDLYDIEYRIGGDRQYKSVCVMIACGGPNIYIDTKQKKILLYWGFSSADYPISYAAAEAIDAYFEELYSC